MFSENIRQLKIADPVADQVFGHIRCETFNGDVSMVGTMRALLCDRVPTYSEFRAYVQARSNDGCCRMSNSVADVLDMHASSLSIVSLTASKEQNTNIFNFIDEHIDPDHGTKALPDVQKYFDQLGIRVRVVIHPVADSCGIAIEHLTLKKYHMLQALIPRYFPNLFGANPKLDDFENSLLHSLLEKTPDSYLRLMDEFSERFDFRAMQIKNQLHGFEKSLYREQLTKKEAAIQQIKAQIENLYSQISEYHEQLTQENVYLTGLRTIIADDSATEDEVMNYFLANKGLNLVDFNNNNLKFTVETTLSNFNPDVFEKYIDNRNSILYAYNNSTWTKDRLRLLLNAIFGEERLKWRVCAAYRLNFATGRYDAISDYNYGDLVLSTHLPNQHIQRYNCTGTYGGQIHEAVCDFDYVGAVSLCCASAANINFTDSTVTDKFMQELTKASATRFIELPDGSTVTPLKAVEWMEQEEGSDE